MTGLWTIGYEGAALEDFLDTLRQAGVTKILDVREIPISRRKGFSKTVLEQALSGYDIDYQHELRLGSPREMRHGYAQPVICKASSVTSRCIWQNNGTC